MTTRGEDAEQRAIRRYEQVLFPQGWPDDLPRPDVHDVKGSFFGCRILIGEHARDIWTELRKPFVRLLNRVNRGDS